MYVWRHYNKQVLADPSASEIVEETIIQAMHSGYVKIPNMDTG